MSKRLKFTRGADAYQVGDVVFTKGGHSQTVPDEVADVLLAAPDLDFEEISDEDRAAEDEADRKAAAYQAALVSTSNSEEEEAARRRAAVYQSQSTEEAEAEIDQHSSSTAPNEDTGGSSPEPDAPEDGAEVTDEEHEAQVKTQESIERNVAPEGD